MTGRGRASSTLLALAATLIQCYATRTGDGCAPLSEHVTMAQCRKLASEYQKFDTRDLRVKGVPAVVSYYCGVGNPPQSEQKRAAGVVNPLVENNEAHPQPNAAAN